MQAMTEPVRWTQVYGVTDARVLPLGFGKLVYLGTGLHAQTWRQLPRRVISRSSQHAVQHTSVVACTLPAVVWAVTSFARFETFQQPTCHHVQCMLSACRLIEFVVELHACQLLRCPLLSPC